MRLGSRLIPILAAIGLLAAACTSAGSTPAGSPSAAPSSPPSTPATNPSPAGSPVASSSDDLVLRVAYEGGLLAPNAQRAKVPFLSVYADGRIMMTGAVPAIYPGPLMVTLVFRTVGADGAANILAAAAAAGLTGADTTYPAGPTLDVPDTVITVVHDGRRTVSTFGFLGADAAGGPPSSNPASQAIAAASALVGRLSGNDSFGGTVGAEGTYQPLGFQLFVTPGGPQVTDPSLARPAVAWPLATPLASFGKADPLGGNGARVGVVSGSDAATLGPILASASQLTGFASGGTEWTIVPRPLLPDEVAALGG